MKDLIITTKGDLIIPIFSEAHFLGAIQIKQGGTLDEQSIISIREMLEQIGSILLEPVESSFDLEREFKVEKNKYIINLIGEGNELRQKIAVELYQTWGSWSLLPWSESGISHWTIEELEDLSGICIYVSDISELPLEEIQQLFTLTQMPKSMRPHLIVGSQMPLSELTKNIPLLPDWIEAISKRTIFIDQMPKEHLRLRQVLEMLFEEKSNSKMHGLVLS